MRGHRAIEHQQMALSISLLVSIVPEYHVLQGGWHSGNLKEYLTMDSSRHFVKYYDNMQADAGLQQRAHILRASASLGIQRESRLLFYLPNRAIGKLWAGGAIMVGQW